MISVAQAEANKVELLSVELLTEYRREVQEFIDVYMSLSLGLGWHYLLDLSWASAQLNVRRGDLVLDAGAGLGIMQWWLTRRGTNVLAVDTRDRADLDSRFRSWCKVRGLRPGDLRPAPGPTLRSFLPPLRPWRWHHWPRKLRGALAERTRRPSPPAHAGTLTIYTQDLSSMPDVADNSVDAIVSISALEHNTPEGLRTCVRELMRVLKPGGRLVATLGAAKQENWFHEPSKGWCYTDTTLREIFDLPSDAASNYDRFDELFRALQRSEELQRNLDPYYATSGDNGMPWGIWDPKYLPVGVLKTKPLT